MEVSFTPLVFSGIVLVESEESLYRPYLIRERSYESLITTSTGGRSKITTVELRATASTVQPPRFLVLIIFYR